MTRVDDELRRDLESYFEAVAAGSTDVPAWRAWWKVEEARLRSAFGSSRALRLRFAPHEAAPRLVEELDLAVDARRLASRLAGADLDGWDPPPLSQPAAGAYEAGRWRDGDRLLRADAHALQRRVETSDAEDVEAAQELGEQLHDACECLVRGETRLGVGLLLAVASCDDDVELIGRSVLDARRLLQSIGGPAPSGERRGGASAAPELRGAEPSALLAAAALTWLRAKEDTLAIGRSHVRDLLARARAVGVALPELDELESRL